MKHRPEEHYPLVDGGHEWLKEQLDAEMVAVFGEVVTIGGAKERKILTKKYALVSTPETAADVRQGRLLATKLWFKMTMVLLHRYWMRTTTPRYYWFDVKPLQAQGRSVFATAHEAERATEDEFEERRQQSLDDFVDGPVKLPRGAK